MELVRYIHLNPLRAGLVSDLKQLARFAYSGHSRIMGTVKSDFQDVDKVLGLFDDHRQRARRQYAEFVGKGVFEGRKPELTGVD